MVVTADPSLAPSAGGVVLTAQNGKIHVDNTLEARLKLSLHDLAPAVRDMLFPSARSPVLVKPKVQVAHSSAK